VILQFWPINEHELPRWLSARLQKVNLRAEPSALQLLASMVEGNLLAASQEVEKLSLLFDVNTVLTVDHISEAVCNNSHFSVFTLTEAILSGDAARSLHVFSNLQREKTEPILILWAIHQELDILIKINVAIAQGENAETVLAKQRNMWPKRKTLFKKAMNRHELTTLYDMLNECARIDKIIKGIEDANAWDALQLLCLSVTNARLIPSPPAGEG